MKNLVLNNHHPIDQDETFAKFLETNFTENRETWNHFEVAFWNENKKETMERFLSLKSGDNILCHTVFVQWQQLELMILLLHGFISKKIKLNVYISHYELKETLNKFFNEYESSLCPDTNEYNDNPDLRERFKKDINDKMLQVIDYHNIYELNEAFHNRKKPKAIRSKDIVLEQD